MSNRVLIDQSNNTITTDTTSTQNNVILNPDNPDVVNIVENVSNIIAISVPGLRGLTGEKGPSGSMDPYYNTGSFSGSFIGSFSGSLLGTSSWAVSASWAPSLGVAGISSYIATGSITASVSNTDISASFRLTSGSNTLLNVTKDGFVWIGNGAFTNQGYQLDVNGTARVSGNMSFGTTSQTGINYPFNGKIRFVSPSNPFFSGLTGYDFEVWTTAYFEASLIVKNGGGIGTTGASTRMYFNGNNAYFRLNNGTNDIVNVNEAGVLVSLENQGIPNSSAILEAKSTTKGFLPTRTNTTASIASPAQGLLTYITSSGEVEGLWQYRTGSEGWVQFLHNSSSIPASNIVGLNLSRIATGSITASVNTGTNIFNIISGSSTLVAVNNNGNIGIRTPTIGSNLPNGWSSTGSFIEVTGISNEPSGIFLRRGSFSGIGLDMWSQNNAGVSYIDNRYDAAGTFSALIIRVRTSGTPRTVAIFDDEFGAKIGDFTNNRTNALRVEGDMSFRSGGGARTITGPLNTSLIINALPSNSTEGVVLQYNGTASFLLNNNGRVIIQNGGTFADAGYRLDVVGTARINGSVSLAAGLNTKTFSQDDTNVSLYLWTRSGFGTYTGTNSGFYHHFSNGNTFSLNNNTDNIYIGSTSALAANVISSVGLLASSISQNYSVAIGSNSQVQNYAGVSIGTGAKTTGGTTNYGGVAIGFNALANNYSFAFGYTVADDGEFVAASAISFNQLKPITNVYFGSGKILGDPGGTVRNGAGASYTINGSGANGTNFAGGNITIAGGKGTGTGTSGDVVFSTATTTTSGTTLQSLTERVKVFGNTGNVLIQNGGTFADAGYRLDVSGSTRMNGDTLINGVLQETITTNRQVASYSLVLADRGKLVEMNVASANTLTVPLNSSIAFPIGSKIDIAQYGAGQTTIVATGGVTIRSTNGWLKLNAQYAAATLIKIATDEWYLFGNLNA